jgi:hypothetical protein
MRLSISLPDALAEEVRRRDIAISAVCLAIAQHSPARPDAVHPDSSPPPLPPARAASLRRRPSSIHPGIASNGPLLQPHDLHCDGDPDQPGLALPRRVHRHPVLQLNHLVAVAAGGRAPGCAREGPAAYCSTTLRPGGAGRAAPARAGRGFLWGSWSAQALRAP